MSNIELRPNRSRPITSNVIQMILVPDGEDSDQSFDHDSDDPDWNNEDEGQPDMQTIRELTETSGNVEMFIPPEDSGDKEDGGGDTEVTPSDMKFNWRSGKPPTADNDIVFTGDQFSLPPLDDLTPIQYFSKFFEPSIMDIIAEQSNKYAMEKDGIILNTNSAEIEIFLGIHMLAGIVRMPSYRMYWKPATRYEPIASQMSRDRFDKLRTYLHMNDNNNAKNKGDPEYDALFKVRPVLDIIRANCLKVEPEEFHSVDETMIPFKGNLAMKQYIKSKPHKWGIKVFTRAGCSGLVYDFMVYKGKNTVQNDRGLGVGGEVVLTLCEGLPNNRNHKCFFDNWFTSPELLIELQSRGIHGTGTIGKQRLRGCMLKADNLLKKEGRGSHDIKYDTDSGLSLVKWSDNKCVTVASSYLNDEPVGHCRRWCKKERKYIEVARPHIIDTYNSRMGGVDLSDMLMSLYRIDIRPKRWYLRLLYYFLNLSIVNGWFLYKRHCSQRRLKSKPLVDFMASIADSLIKEGKPVDQPSRKRGRPSAEEDIMPVSKTLAPRSYSQRPQDSVQLDKVDHWPIHKEKRGRCKWCKDNLNTNTMCSKCLTYLCFNKGRNCYKDFHNLKKPN